MAYSKTTWVDEILAAAARYNILTDGGSAIYEDVQINLATSVSQAGTALEAAIMQNIEDWIEAVDAKVENIGDTTISAAQWGYLGGMDQSVAQAASPTFANVYVPDGGFVGVSGADGWTFDASNGDITTASKVGIGITAPGAKLHVTGTIYASDSISTAGAGGAFIANPRDGSGTAFQLYNPTGDNIRLYGGSDLFTINSSGNVGIGTSAFDGTAAGVLAIANGTEPAAGTANQSYLYAKDISSSSELFGMDEAGNAAQLTPHPAEFLDTLPTAGREYPWAYSATNYYLGKQIDVDMMGAIRKLEELSGEQYIYMSDLDPDKIWDWDADQERQATERDAAIVTAKDLQKLLRKQLKDAEDTAEIERLQDELDAVIVPGKYIKKRPPKWLVDRGVKSTINL